MVRMSALFAQFVGLTYSSRLDLRFLKIEIIAIASPKHLLVIYPEVFDRFIMGVGTERGMGFDPLLLMQK